MYEDKDLDTGFRGQNVEHITLGAGGGLSGGGDCGLLDGAKATTDRATPARGDKLLKRPASKRSGGPRSEAGIAAASKNSLSHGAYAKRLPDYHEFFSYADEARVEFKPQGLMEERIVMSLAHEAYKGDRLQEIERARMQRASEQVHDPYALAQRLHFPWAGTHAELLLEPLNRQHLQRAIHAAWVELAAPPSLLECDQLVCMQDQRVMELYEQACELLGSKALLEHMHEEFFMRLDLVMHEARGSQSYLGRSIHQRCGEMLLVHYWLFRNALRVSVAVQQSLQAQVLDVVGDERLSRANSHVSSRVNEAISSLAALRSMKQASSDRLWHVPAVRPRARAR